MTLARMVGYAGILISLGCSSPHKDPKKETPLEVLDQVYFELERVESDIYLSEGFQFTPGGGYWFYPNGIKTLSEQQRDEISKRIELRTAGLSKLETAIDELREKYK